VSQAEVFEVVDLSAIDLAQVGRGLAPASARSLLLTTLGELVWPSGESARTAALVAVLTGLGVEERAARQAIVRAAGSDWIRSERHGREVSWTLTPRFEHVFEEGSLRVTSLSDPFDEWNGEWLVLLVTIPQALKATRKRLYSDLTWAGFGNPAPGVWVSPHPERRHEVGTLIESLGLTDSTMSFIGEVEAIGLDVRRIVERGWNLDGLAARYAAVEAAFQDADPAPGDDMLRAHIRLLSAWQSFPFSDPQLPEALEPDWIGRRVSRRIEQLRARWGEQVHQRWAEINAPS
jgi:phenylacetic acid degradation operon negative regulatory protein